MCTHVWLCQWLSGCDPRQLILKFLQSQKYFVYFQKIDAGFSWILMDFLHSKWHSTVIVPLDCLEWCTKASDSSGKDLLWLSNAFEHSNGIKWPYQNHEDIWYGHRKKKNSWYLQSLRCFCTRTGFQPFQPTCAREPQPHRCKQHFSYRGVSLTVQHFVNSTHGFVWK